MRIPPPIVMTAIGAIMFVTDQVIDIWRQPLEEVSILVLFLAALFLFPALKQFVASKTTVHPFRAHKTSALVTTGVYRVTRNPMYLGMVLVLVSWLLYLGNPLNVFYIGLFVLFINRFQIGYEERVLRELFGEEYDAYAKTVRRWI